MSFHVYLGKNFLQTGDTVLCGTRLFLHQETGHDDHPLLAIRPHKAQLIEEGSHAEKYTNRYPKQYIS